MPSPRCRLELAQLSPQARRRFVDAMSGRGTLRPIWFSPQPADTSWKLLGAGGIALAVLLALLGGDAPQGWPWLIGWGCAAVAITCSAVTAWRARREAAALPFLPGTYLFATDLVEVRDGLCALHNLDQLTDIRIRNIYSGAAAKGAELQFVLGRDVVSAPVLGKQVGQRVIDTFWQARNVLMEALSAGAWEEVARLDPLYEARYGGSWEAACRPVGSMRIHALAAGKPLLGLHPAALRWGVVLGLVLAPLLWFGSNMMRDELAFRRARSANTVQAWKHYLSRGAQSRHRDAVVRVHLPAAALRAAKKTGTLTALREFLARHSRGPAADEARAILQAAYERSGAAVKTQVDPSMQPAMLSMLQWLNENGSNIVEIRFGESAQASLIGYDTVLQELLEVLRVRDDTIAPIAPVFAEAPVRKREDSVFALIKSGFSHLAEPGIIEFRRGATFAGVPTGFAHPAIAIQWTAEPLVDEEHRPFVDEDSGQMHLPLEFSFEVYLAVPGSKAKPIEFKLIPTDYVLPKQSKRSLYERMADMAFQELQQRIAAAFFPRHAPEREIKLVPHQKTAPSSPTTSVAPSDRPVSSATGFCISPLGYIVTARHFTEGTRRFKVVTTSGRFDADLVREDPANDVALLKLRNDRPAGVLPIRPSESAKLGESVATIGFPLINVQGQQPKVGRGEISSLAGRRDDPNHFQISVPLQPGNSGGPLLDLKGNVVGVVVAGFRGLQGVNYAVKSSFLLSFLKSIPELRDLPAPNTIGPAAFEDMVDRARLATVLLEGYQ